MKPLRISDHPKLLNDLVASLRQASGGASQLAHSMRNPGWIVVRDATELMNEWVLQVATFATKISVLKP